MKKIKLYKLLNSFKSVNTINSNLAVNCVCRNECASRHTELCESCRYNIGVENHSYYKER